MPLFMDESRIPSESWPADQAHSHPTAFVAEGTRRATADLNAALNALEYLIIQVKDVHEPPSGIQACFSQAFSDVQLALARREILERLGGTLTRLSPDTPCASPGQTPRAGSAGESVSSTVIYG
ncbi:hypothetical protein [Streptomyces sp. UNOC14_S4]|uniref:hypothetical protein n=1 Tax=Streptomyces sp. UNOC14_S4 TaxID=2872340 RepID=UPI001E461A59|nr:hypothetical protein [Streptomyces sp. UNOC14_S4]MCC3768836.1 hypothetical protein [Streptomyces sp. UNOC14_S4]